MWLSKPDLCSFVIPTLGRNTLKRTLQSLLDLQDWNWRAIVVFDGIKPVELSGLNPNINYLEDNHFIVIESPKLAHAGLLRNVGIEKVDTTWTAFVDDDDWLEPTYLNRLKYYSLNQDLDIIVFSYYDAINRNLQPPPYLNSIKECNVGISFAIKTNFIREHNLQFTPFAIEDFRFLDSAVNAGAKYLITHDIQYKVGGRGGWLK